VAGKSLKQSSVHLSAAPGTLAANFAAVGSFDQLAAMLELTPFQLHHFTHSGQRYTPLILKKKHGGTRIISAPIVGLKILQHKLNQVLQAVYAPKSVVHGFVQNRGVVSNAESHARARYVLNIDLQGFFDNITFPRVRGMFMAKPYSKNKTVATVLARICCYQGVLPQGAPTSPIVSNMLLGRMDSQLKVLARTHKCTYTRYADDISFSTFVNIFPRTIAHFAIEEAGGALEIGSALNDLINSNGFAINPAKSRLQHSSGRQVVTGLTANRFPNVPQEFVRQVRAMLHAWGRFGLNAAAVHFFQSHDYKERSPDVLSSGSLFKKIVKGKLDYLGMVRGHDSRAHLSLLEKYATLSPEYTWPSSLPPRELKISVLETAVFAVEGPTSQGTGFVFSDKGLITCAHVVAKQAQLTMHRQGDTQKYPVSVVYIDEDRDLALLAFSGVKPANSSIFEMASVHARKEDQIVLMGYPTTGPAVSSLIEKGAVTALYTRFGQARLSVSCTIFKGNSGGPVLDRNFRLIGVAANGPSKLDPKGTELSGVIPISVLADFLTAASAQTKTMQP
jgi:RNA-directed DNA polymerase